MQTEPNQLADVFTLLTQSFIQTAPLEVTDPKFSTFLDSYSIFQQLELNKLLKQKIAEDPTDKAAAALLRAHVLFEGTRARMARIAEAASRSSEPNCPERDDAMNFLLIELEACEGRTRPHFKSPGPSQSTALLRLVAQRQHNNKDAVRRNINRRFPGFHFRRIIEGGHDRWPSSLSVAPFTL